MAGRGRLVAVEGPSASGKTTLVRAAARTLGWQPLAEAFDRLDPAPSLEFGSSRELLRLEGVLLTEEARRYREAQRACARGVTVLADTGFLGPVTYTRGLVALGRAPASVEENITRSARSLLRRRALGIPELTLYLSTPAGERARRARADPKRHPTRLFPRHEAVGRIERTYFEQLFPAALPGRFRTLRGDRPRASMVADVRAAVEELTPTPASPADGLVILSLLRTSAGAGRRRNPGPNR
jgi:thymidylate kinase